MPLGFQPYATPDGMAWRPITAIEMHLRALKQAGASRATVVIGETKNDVVRYVGSGARYGLPIAYLYQQHLRGMPFALDMAAPWVAGATTLFSMPDTLITPVETMARLAQHHTQHPADLTVGLFRTDAPHKFGMVELDASGAIVDFVDKPAHTDLKWMWGIAAWSPQFSRFLGDFLGQYSTDGPECVLSDIFLAALRGGLLVQALPFEEARYHDIGTPEDFQAVVFALALQQTAAIKQSQALDYPLTHKY
jgi:glucose-1-phosphate thymidylyltransferase